MTLSELLQKPIDNPLLFTADLAPFELIESWHVEPAMLWLLSDLERELVELESDSSTELDDLLGGLEQLSARLGKAWGAVSHLLGVANSEELREAHNKIQPLVVAISLRLSQSPALYRRFKAFRGAPDFDARPEVERRVVEARLLKAELSGVSLEHEQQARFTEIASELAELSTRFSNNLLDATKAYELLLEDPAEVVGLPTSYLAQAAQSAQAAGHEGATAEQGPWRIGLDMPSVVPFLKHSRRRDLRELLFRALTSLASSGETDNGPLIDRILELRSESAQLLGYANHGEVSLASKMAESVASVDVFHEDLLTIAYPAALAEHRELQAFAEEEGELEPWDIAHWTERLRSERYDLDEEALRAYFPLPKVLEGLFGLARKLFGIEVKPADGEQQVWNPEVRYFRVEDLQGKPLASFFLDPYSRPGTKRGGAWMNSAVGRSRRLATGADEVRLPTAYMVCNQTPPLDGQPSLMSVREVTTLFHEFGHCLQHMLSTVDEGLASGISGIEWDAVELPSKFMENWIYVPEVMASISTHHETGEPLPQADLERLQAARTFRAGGLLLAQLRQGMLDMNLHSKYDPSGEQSVLDVERALAKRTRVVPPLPEARVLCSFRHIFAGAYSAGYYSYRWAEVLSADAFAAFEEAGLGDVAQLERVGRAFRDTILASGGSRHPLDVFKDFRGRAPSTEALLRHAGLSS